MSALDPKRTPSSRAVRSGGDDVAALLILQLKNLRSDRSYRFDDEIDAIRASDGTVIAVGNLHTEYLNAPEKARAQVIERFAAAMTPPAMPKTLAQARPHLLPAFRNLYGADLGRIQAGIADPAVITRALAAFTPELGVSVVYDTPNSMMMVDASTLGAWGCSVDDVLAVALDNLRKKSAPRFAQATPGLYRSAYGDDYDAVRLLLPELVQQLPLKGTPVAMVPNRGCLLIAGDQDVAAMAAMLQAASKVLEEDPRPLGSEMLRPENGRWRVYQPAGAFALHLRNLRVQVQAVDYKAQKSALDQRLSAAGEDTFVATCSLHKKNSGEIFTYAVLSKGLLPWLPKTDVLILIEDPNVPNPVSKIVSWDDFEKAAGHLLEKLPYALPRFRLTADPDPAVVNRLTALELGG